MNITRLSFENVFADESGGNIKTPQSEYQPEGKFPVIDQGKAFIAGYVDDEARICGSGRPAIVFGDHTRCVKYIDEPFCMGADGVKVLRPKIDADLKYLYYYLKQLQLPDAGYDRHFKYLKRSEIVLLPLPEQRRIAAILDKADTLLTKRREALAQLDHLAQSIFVEMFGDPAANPKGWPNRAMSTLFEASPIFGTMIPPSADGGEWLSLRVANIQDWRLDLTDQKFVTLPANMVERHSVRDNDLLLARAIASQEHLGKAVVVRPAGRQWAFDSHLMRLRFDHTQALPEFIRHLWMTTGGRTLFLKATRRSAVQFNINTKEMNALELPIPPIQLQRQFIDRIEALNLVRHKQELALAEFACLFTALQHRAFRGEL